MSRFSLLIGANYYHASNNNSNVSNNLVQDFMDLDEFFEATTDPGVSSVTTNGSRNGSSHSFGFNANVSANFNANFSTTPFINADSGVNTLTLDSSGDSEVAPAPSLYDMDTVVPDNAYESLLLEFQQIEEAINSRRNDLSSNLGYYDGQITTQQQNPVSLPVDRPSPVTSLECNPTKDKRYLDRRRKNNLAAKRSRDAKRLREISVVERYNFLDEENKRLKEEISVMQERADVLEKKLGKAQEGPAN